MQVGFVDVIRVFRGAVAGAPEIADDIPGGDDAAFLQLALIGVILAQMGIIVVPFFVKAADAEPPSAVLIPADGFHIAGFDGDDGRARLPHHVMA